ncbi:uncharacterized protein LOC131932817 isoform X2 [Physella acuta]|uniref:uncharacterized protein LOC131932817 isoform X2 n=1 Tax=Physella acuta TaxID=109671 RepID=UPI0027DD1D32|nr:uncharacterized protein LOC131932817 isoform X2 [Physella acuta]
MFYYQDGVSWSYTEWLSYFQKAEFTDLQWDFTAWYSYMMLHSEGGFQCSSEALIQAESAIVLNLFQVFTQQTNQKPELCLNLKNSIKLAKNISDICNTMEVDADMYESSSKISVLRFSRMMHLAEFVTMSRLLCASTMEDMSFIDGSELGLGFENVAVAQCHLADLRDSVLAILRLELNWEDSSACRSVSQAVEDISQKVGYCSLDVRSTLSLLISQMKNTQQTICTPPSCNVHYAGMCLMNAESFLQEHETALKNETLNNASSVNRTMSSIRYSICRSLKYALACATNHTIGCQTSIYSSISPHFDQVKAKFSLMCPEMVPAQKMCLVEREVKVDAQQVVMAVGSSFLYNNSMLCQIATMFNDSQDQLLYYCKNNAPRLHCWSTACSGQTCTQTVETCAQDKQVCSMTVNVSSQGQPPAVNKQSCALRESCHGELSEEGRQVYCEFNLCNQLTEAGTELTCTCDTQAAANEILARGRASNLTALASYLRGCSLGDRQGVLNLTYINTPLEDVVLNSPTCGNVCPTLQQLKAQCLQATGNYCQQSAVDCMNRAVVGCSPVEQSSLLYGVIDLVYSSENCSKATANSYLSAASPKVYNITHVHLMTYECLTYMKQGYDVKSVLTCFQDVLLHDFRLAKVESLLADFDMYLSASSAGCKVDTDLLSSIFKASMSVLTGTYDTSLCRNVLPLMSSWYSKCGNVSVENMTATFSLVCQQDNLMPACNYSAIRSCFTQQTYSNSQFFQTLERCIKEAASSCKGPVLLEFIKLVEKLSRAHGINSSSNSSMTVPCECDPAAAVNCIMDVHHMAKQPFPDWEALCPQVEESELCARSHVAGCEECKRLTVLEIVSKLNSQLEESCVQPPVTQCPAARAMKCVTDLSQLQVNSQGLSDKAICIKITMARDCVSQLTENCDGLTILSVTESLEQTIKKWRTLECEEPKDQLATCVDVLENKIYSLLGFSIVDLWDQVEADNTSVLTRANDLCREIEIAWPCVNATLNLQKENVQAKIVRRMMEALYSSMTRICQPRQESLQCYTCQGNGQRSCDAGAGTETCRHNEVCETVATDGKATSKGCKPRQACKQGCFNKKCNYCCSDNLCNDIDNGPLDGSCNMTGMAACVLDLSTQFVQGDHIQCRSADAALECIKKARVECELGGMRSLVSAMSSLNLDAEIKVCYIQEANQTCDLGPITTTALYINTNGLEMTTEALCKAINESRQQASQAKKSCPLETYSLIDNTARSLESLVGSLNCSDQFDFVVEDSCRPLDALTCVHTVFGTDNITVISRATCLEFNETVSCMRQAVKGCTSACQLVRVESQLKWLQDLLPDVCQPNVSLVNQTLPQQEIASCLRRFTENLQQNLQQNLLPDLKNASEELQLCFLQYDTDVLLNGTAAGNNVIAVITEIIQTIITIQINISIEVTTSCASSLATVIVQHGVQGFTLPFLSLTQRHLACSAIDEAAALSALNEKCDLHLIAGHLEMLDTLRDKFLIGYCPEIQPIPRCLISQAVDCLSRFSSFFGPGSGSGLCLEARTFVECAVTYTQSCPYDDVISFRRASLDAVDIISQACADDVQLVTRVRCSLLGRIDVQPGCSVDQLGRCLTLPASCSQSEERAACIVEHGGSCLSSVTQINLSNETFEISRCRYGGDRPVSLSSSCGETPYTCNHVKARQCLLDLLANRSSGGQLLDTNLKSAQRCLEENYYCFEPVLSLVYNNMSLLAQLTTHILTITPGWTQLESQRLIHIMTLPSNIIFLLQQDLSVSLYLWDTCMRLDNVQTFLNQLQEKYQVNFYPATARSFESLQNVILALCDNLGQVSQELQLPANGLEDDGCPALEVKVTLNLLLSSAISSFSVPKPDQSVCRQYNDLKARLESSVMAHCSSGFLTQLQFGLKAALMLVGSGCGDLELPQKRCDLQKVNSCITTLYNNLLLLGRSQTVPGLCQLLRETNECVDNFSYKCDRCSLSRLSAQYSSVKRSVEAKCNVDTSPVVCQTENDDLTSCQISKAVKCAVSQVKDTANPFKSREAKCRSLSENLDCVHKYTGSCKGHIPKLGLLDQLVVEKLQNRLGCRTDPEPSAPFGCRPGCWVNKAQQCLATFSSSVADNVFVSRSTCQSINSLKLCVSENTKACSSDEAGLIVERLRTTLAKFTDYETVCTDVLRCAQDFDSIVRQINDLEPEDDSVDTSSKLSSKERKRNSKESVDTDTEDGEESAASSAASSPNLNTLCVRASQAWACVDRSLDIIPAEKRKILRPIYEAVWGAVQARCSDTRDLSCYFCKNGGSPAECKLQTETCPTNKRMCMFRQTLTGNSIKYKAGCTNPNACRNSGAASVRTYCCADELCNTRENSSLTHTEDPDTCQLEYSQACALDFLILSLKSDNISCRDATYNLGCVQKYAASCSNGQALMEASKGAYFALATSSCVIDAGVDSCRSLALDSIQTLLSYSYTSQGLAICKALKTMNRSVSELLVSGRCSQAGQIAVQQSQDFIQSIGATYCSRDHCLAAGTRVEPPEEPQCSGHIFEGIKGIYRAFDEMTKDDKTRNCGSCAAQAIQARQKLNNCNVHQFVTDKLSRLDLDLQNKCNATLQPHIENNCSGSCKTDVVMNFVDKVFSGIKTIQTLTCWYMKEVELYYKSYTSGCSSAQQKDLSNYIIFKLSQSIESCQAESSSFVFSIELKKDIYFSAMSTQLDFQAQVQQGFLEDDQNKTCAAVRGLKAYVLSLPSQLEAYIREPVNSVLLQVEAAGICQEIERKRRESNSTCDLKRLAALIYQMSIPPLISIAPLDSREKICRTIKEIQNEAGSLVASCGSSLSKFQLSLYTALNTNINSQNSRLCPVLHYEEDTCNLTLVSQCRKDFQSLTLYSSIQSETLCSQAKFVLECTSRFSKNCTGPVLNDAQKIETETRIVIRNIVGNSCPALTLALYCNKSVTSLDEACQLDQAKQCAAASVFDFTKVDTPGFCQNLQANVACVQSSMSGCPADQMGALNWSATKVVNGLCNIQDATLNNVCVSVPVCSTKSITDCFFGQQTNSCSGLQKAVNCMQLYLSTNTQCSQSVGAFMARHFVSRYFKKLCTDCKLTINVTLPELSSVQALLNVFTNVQKIFTVQQGSGQEILDYIFYTLKMNISTIESSPVYSMITDVLVTVSAGSKTPTLQYNSSDAVLIDTDTCVYTRAQACLSRQLFRTIFVKLLTPAEKSEFCDSLSKNEVKTCIDQAMSGCPGARDWYLSISSSTANIITDLGVCGAPQLCIPSQAFASVSTLVTLLANFDQDNNTEALCNGRLQAKEQLDTFLFKCSQDEAKTAREAFQKSFSKADVACQDFVLPPPPICPQIPQSSRVCMLSNAVKSLLHFSSQILHTGDSLIWRQQCLNIQSMMVSVATNTTSCDPEDEGIKAILESLEELRSVASDQCPWLTADMCSTEQPCAVATAGCEVVLEQGLINRERTVCQLKADADACVDKYTATCTQAQKLQAQSIMAKKLQAVGYLTDLTCDNGSLGGCLYDMLAQARNIYMKSRTSESCPSLSSHYTCVINTYSNPNNSSYLELAKNLTVDLFKVINTSYCSALQANSCSVQIRKLTTFITQLFLNKDFQETSFCTQSLALVTDSLDTDCSSTAYDIIKQSKVFKQKCTTEVPACEAAETKIKDCISSIGQTTSCQDLQKAALCVTSNLPAQCPYKETWLGATSQCSNLVVLQATGEQGRPMFVSEAGLKATVRWRWLAGSRNFRISLTARAANASALPSCLQGSQVSQPIPQVYCDKVIKSLENDSTEINFTIWATQDYRMDGVQTVLVNFTVIPYQLEANTTTGTVHERDLTAELFQLPMSRIEVDDRDEKKSVCSSINDPHLTTFDQLTYNTIRPGVYILYRHSELPVAVLVRFKQCAAYGTCNCAVTVYAGYNKLTLSTCNKNDSFISFTPGSTAQTLDQLQMRIFSQPDLQTYYVYLVLTKVIVKVTVEGSYLNVWVTPSAENFGLTQGLCGVFDGDRYNDLEKPDGTIYKVSESDNQYSVLTPDSFSELWKVNSESLENIYSPGVKISNSSVQSYCSAWVNTNSTVTSCGVLEPSAFCGVISGEDLSPKLLELAKQVQSSEGKRRKKRAVPVDLSSSDNTTIRESGWPTPSGWTLDKATDFCLDNLFNQPLQACKEAILSLDNTLSALNLEDPVKICIDDIRLSDSTDWFVGSQNFATQLCIQELNHNPLYQRNKTSSDLAIAFMDLTCVPFNCSGHGKCSRGQCMCDSEYVGSGCELPISQLGVPTLIDPHEGFEMCEIGDHSECATVFLLGKNFVNSHLLTCHIKEADFTEHGLESSSKTSTVRGELLGTNVVRCDLGIKSSIKRALMISVSNDGLHPDTNYQLFLAYDPACYSCDFYSCIKNNDVCFIGTKCMPQGETSIYNECQYCDLKTPYKWSIKTEMEGCKDEAPADDASDGMSVTTTALIASGITLLGLLILLVIGLFVYVKRREAFRRRQSQGMMHHHDNQAYQDNPPFYGQPILAHDTKQGLSNNFLTSNQSGAA